MINGLFKAMNEFGADSISVDFEYENHGCMYMVTMSAKKIEDKTEEELKKELKKELKEDCLELLCDKIDNCMNIECDECEAKQMIDEVFGKDEEEDD